MPEIYSKEWFDSIVVGTCEQTMGHQNPHPENSGGLDYPCINWKPLDD